MAGNSSPKTHPSGNGLDAAIRDGVRTELDSRGVGGGGGGNDRLANLEREVSVIKATMLTQAVFDERMRELNQSMTDQLRDINKSLSEVKVEAAKTTLKTVTWLLSAVGGVAGIIFVVYRVATAAAQ
jgi:hypothetical protein